MTWTALPDGQDIAMRPGGWYAAIASIDDPSATEASVKSAMAQFYPDVQLVSFGSQGDAGYDAIGEDPSSSRKRVGLIVRASEGSVDLPWSRGVFLVRPNIYTLVSAWSGGTGAQPQGVPWTAPPTVNIAPEHGNLALWGLAGLTVLAAAWAAYSYRYELEAALERFKRERLAA